MKIEDIIPEKIANLIKRYTNTDNVEDAIKVLATKNLIPYILEILDYVSGGSTINEFFTIYPLDSIIRNISIHDINDKTYVLLELEKNNKKDYVCVVFDENMLRVCTFSEIYHFEDKYRKSKPSDIDTAETNIEL